MKKEIRNNEGRRNDKICIGCEGVDGKEDSV